MLFDKYNLKIIIYFMKMKVRRISNKFNKLGKLIFYTTIAQKTELR